MSEGGARLERHGTHVLLAVAVLALGLVILAICVTGDIARAAVSQATDLRTAQTTLSAVGRDLVRIGTEPADPARAAIAASTDDGPLADVERPFVTPTELDADLLRTRIVASAGALIAVSAIAGAALQVCNVRRRTACLLRTVEHQAETDPLTALPNRRHWERSLRQAVDDTASTFPPTIAIIDLDHFKLFNDAHGHLAGDELLREAAAGWSRLLGADDLLVRLGGEEFGLLLRGYDARLATELVGRLRDDTPHEQSFSAGIAVRTVNETAHDLYARADRALYRAKRSGRACTMVAPRTIGTVLAS